MPRREQHVTDMLKTQVLLSEYQGEVVLLKCSLCSGRGKLSKVKLLAKHGDVRLVNLLNYLSCDC